MQVLELIKGLSFIVTTHNACVYGLLPCSLCKNRLILLPVCQVLQGALPRQYTGASIVSKKS